VVILSFGACMQKRRCLGIAGLAVLASLTTAGAVTANEQGQVGDGAPYARLQMPGFAMAQPVRRTIYMATVEPRGTANPDEVMPTDPLPAGGGYIVRPTSDTLWEAVSYRWEPGTLVARQGEEITLEIFGINGRAHDITIEAFGQKGSVARGQLSRITFTPDKTGIFNVVCTIHQPSMTADLVVLPSSL
jgi:hypothetical protein